MNYDVESYEFGDIDLEVAVKDLPIRQRQAIILYLMGYTRNEIAGKMDISESGARKTIGRATRNLRRRLMDGF